MQLSHQGLPSQQNIVKAGKLIIQVLHENEKLIQILPC